jgi:hypothetical protein
MPLLCGSAEATRDHITAAIGDFYLWASGGSITLPASRYNYSSD